MEFTLLAAQPVPVWAAAIDDEAYRHRPPITEYALQESFDVLSPYAEFRGVGLDRLPTILATGVDVEPTTAPIFVSDFNKAWGYGDWPKVVMAFDGRHLQRTYRQIVISEASADEIARLMVDYPTRIEDLAGERLWLTRFSETDTRAATPYEAEFARWIPGNPFDALLAVFVFIPEVALRALTASELWPVSVPPGPGAIPAASTGRQSSSDASEGTAPDNAGTGTGT